MTKTMKIIISSVVIIAIGLISGIVYRYEKQLAVHQEMVEIVKENKSLVTADLKDEDLTQKITEINLDFETIEPNPMGGITVNGYINGNRKLIFYAGFDKSNGKEAKIFSTGTDISANLNRFLKAK
ncbi:DUF1310 family protein [Latilactobacillus fuchuensis]|uniref:DUF1310 family protein n=1 Tax=Latilactobacillus fuchuensis DSM 14340 = JCM 11249 TaxID=1423747 RepID=A0A0R1RWF5_9LACO|nr:DUF1310 family protein [Latilactobacillus fuchuensis]KRL61404.1 hypothetical protein FC69_GL000809 [Latilactobacillus fuchuensis DSM 14340 = JCM 11249]